MRPEITFLFIAAIVNAVFSLLILRGTRNRINQIFATFVIFASFWPLGIALFLLARDLSVAVHLANFYYISAAFIPVLFLHFVLTFIKYDLHRYTSYLLYLPVATLCVILLFDTNWLVSEVIIEGWRKEALLDIRAYSAYGMGFIVYVLACFAFLFRALRNTTGDVVRKQLQFITYGTLPPYIVGMIFNLILPWVGNYDLIWIGPLFSIMMVSSVGYAIAKHHLFDIKAIATEIFITALWVFMIARIFLETDPQEQVFHAVLFLSTLIFGILVIKSVLKEVRTRERMQGLAKELATANEKLKQLDQQKSEFLSIASHQLRSPLTAIKGYASLLLEGSFGELPAKAKGAVERIAVSSERLVLVVEDFLNISRIDQGRMKYEFNTVDMVEVIDNVLQELQNNISTAGLKLIKEYDDSNSHDVMADYGKMKQVVANLIDNAMKFTKLGHIKIKLYREQSEDLIHLEVQDTGAGVDPEVMPMLFQKYRTTSYVSEGGLKTGLGLYVAKELVKAHEGKIWAVSPGIGQGTTLHVTLSAI